MGAPSGAGNFTLPEHPSSSTVLNAIRCYVRLYSHLYCRVGHVLLLFTHTGVQHDSNNTSNVTSKTGIAYPSGAPGFINNFLWGYHMGEFIGKDTFGLKKVPNNHIWSISPPEYRELSHRTLDMSILVHNV
jgi:hypothetical protein